MQVEPLVSSPFSTKINPLTFQQDDRRLTPKELQINMTTRAVFSEVLIAISLFLRL